MAKMINLIALIFAILSCVYAHPYATFLMTLTDVNGVKMTNNFTSSDENTLYFTFQDELHNDTTIKFGDFTKYHARWVHLLFVSQDWSWTAHVHPDDYSDMSTSMNADSTVFFIKIAFPLGGDYSIAASFLYVDPVGGNTREGFAQTEFHVITKAGDLTLGKVGIWDYNITNRFTTYPVNDSDIYDKWINVTSNLDANGFWATLTVAGGSALPNENPVNGSFMSGMNMRMGDMGMNSTVNIVEAGKCTWMYLTVYWNDSTGMNPAPMIPIMAAPVHFTLSNGDNAVYHAHGTYIPANMSFPMVLSAMKGMTMTDMMKMQTSDPAMFNLTMNAEMIGALTNETLDCLSDEGVVVDSMMGMMDMSEYYGPTNFTTIAGAFDFPDDGNWRVFAYMKMRMSDGSERLIVPHFSISAYNKPDMNSMMSSSMMSSASQNLISFFVIIAILFVLF